MVLFRAMRALVLLVLAVGVFTASIVVVARAFGFQQGPLYYLVALTPYFGAAMAVTALACLALRSRLLALVATIPALIIGFWWLPVFLPGPAATSDGLKVMTVNLLYGQADPEAVVAAVRDQQVDVLSVQELTAAAARRLRQAGLQDDLPYSYLHASSDPGSAAGTGIWSAYPLSRRVASDDLGFTNLAAKVAAPDGPVTIFAVHPIPPSLTDGLLGADIFEGTREFLSSRRGPAIAAGDFNATRDNVPLRSLESNGWTDAATAARAGFVRTWPTTGYPVGPLVAIDHVLTRKVPSAVHVTTVEIPGSDHRAVVATLP